MATDPVCKMAVDERKAKFTSTHGDKRFYFCSASCEEKFEWWPTRYLNQYKERTSPGRG